MRFNVVTLAVYLSLHHATTTHVAERKQDGRVGPLQRSGSVSSVIALTAKRGGRGAQTAAIWRELMNETCIGSKPPGAAHHCSWVWPGTAFWFWEQAALRRAVGCHAFPADPVATCDVRATAQHVSSRQLTRAVPGDINPTSSNVFCKSSTCPTILIGRSDRPTCE